MKKLAFLFSTLVLFFLSMTLQLANAKGADQERLTVSINFQLDNDDYVTLFGEGTRVKTPSSVVLKTYKFKLSEESLQKIDFGYFANKIFGISLEIETGETLIGAGYLNKAGYLTVNVHKNGSGNFAPKGWLISFGLII